MQSLKYLAVATAGSLIIAAGVAAETLAGQGIVERSPRSVSLSSMVDGEQRSPMRTQPLVRVHWKRTRHDADVSMSHAFSGDGDSAEPLGDAPEWHRLGKDDRDRKIGGFPHGDRIVFQAKGPVEGEGSPPSLVDVQGAHPDSRVTLSVGDAIGEDVQSLQVAFGQEFASPWQPFSWLTLQPFWEVSLGHVAPEGELGRFDDSWTVGGQVGGRVPVAWDGRLFAEGAIGPVYISNEEIDSGDDTLDLSSNILFRNRLGIGLYLDASRRVFAAYQLQHTSNAGLGSTNPGLDQHVLSVGVAFP